MHISINTGCFMKDGVFPKENMENVLLMLKESGFTAADMTLKSVHKHSMEGDHTAYFRGIKEYSDAIGLAINQTHAPFFEGVPIPEHYTECLLKCLDYTAVLGAGVMVVHADAWYEKDYLQWDYQKVLQTVYEVYAPVVKRAEKLGVKIAMETLHEWLGNLYHRVRLCTFVEELDDIIGKFHSPNVGVCWDFGHANVVYKEEQFAAMKRLKNKVIATHVHDNKRKWDDHILPYQGAIDWSVAMKTLAECGYEGDLTLEIGKGNMPPPLLADYMRYACKTVNSLKELFETYT